MPEIGSSNDTATIDFADKVIVCGSEVLRLYTEKDAASNYIDDIQMSCSIAPLDLQITQPRVDVVPQKCCKFVFTVGAAGFSHCTAVNALTILASAYMKY